MNSTCAVSQTTTLGSARSPDHVTCSLYFLLYLIIYIPVYKPLTGFYIVF